MEIKWLEDFLSLANSGSFSQSAESRHVTQPAFSRRIKALESWLGTTLIDRRTYPVSLTQEGRDFRETAEETLRHLYFARDQFQNKSRQSKMAISFATLDSLSTHFFPGWLSSFADSETSQSTKLRVLDLKECLKIMNEGACDFLLCYGHDAAPLPLDPVEFPSYVLAKERLIPVSLPDQNGRPLYSWPSYTKEPTPFLAYAENSFLKKTVDALLERYEGKYLLNTVYENAASTSIKAMASHGYGLGWVPERLITKEIASGQLVVAASDEWIPTLEIKIYRSQNRSRKAVEEFWKKIMADKPDALVQPFRTERMHSFLPALQA